MNEFGWQTLDVETLIKDGVIEIGDGYRAKNIEMGKSGLPFMRISNITDEGLDFDSADILGEKSLHKVGNKISQAGDVVFTTKGTVGRFAYVKPGTPKFVYSPQVSFWRVRNQNILSSRFLLYWLQGPEFTNQVYRVKRLTDMADYVNLRDQRRMKIDAPSLPIQRKIADVLSAYDDLIEVNTRRIRILEQMAQAVYHEWFGKVDVKSLPQGWEVVIAGDFGEVITGKTPSKAVKDYFGSDVPFIKIPDMHGNLFCIQTGEMLSFAGEKSQPKKTIPPNSICVSCIGTAGLVTITTAPAQTNQQINTIILNNQNEREFLYFSLMGLSETINLYGANGATIVNLNKGKFEALTIIKPPDELINRYHEIAYPMFEQVRVLQLKNANLRQTRDLLLPRLVSGEVDVEGLEIVSGDK